MCSIFSRVLKLFSRVGFQKRGQRALGRATPEGFHQLWLAHAYAVLPVGTLAFVARDLRLSGMLRRPIEAPGIAAGAQEVHAGLSE